MSFSIVDSKVKNYTRPIYELIINREQKQEVVMIQPQIVHQEQKVQVETEIQVPQPIQNQPFLLEKRKPFQLKSRERFQARRTMVPPVISQPLPESQNQTVTQPQAQPQTQPLPLVQLPSAPPPPPPTEAFDEFGYSIDDI